MTVPLLIPGWPVAIAACVSFVLTIGILFGSRWTGVWGPHRVVGVTWQQSGDWCLKQGDQTTYSSGWRLEKRSQITAFYMSFRWTNSGRVAHAVVFLGEMPADEWRRWQTRLRYASSADRPGQIPEL